jgi:hypothetical protein
MVLVEEFFGDGLNIEGFIVPHLDNERGEAEKVRADGCEV